MLSANFAYQYLSTEFFMYTKQILERIKEDGAKWVAQQRFWLFGTACYVDGTEITQQEIERDARHYFNTVDKALLARKDYDEGRRLKRLVFIEKGRTRTNAHIHFFIKGTQLQQYRHIKYFTEINWTRHIIKARDCIVKDNIDFINERKGYGWKELDSLDSEVLFLPCCHL